MAILKNTTISDTGYLRHPVGTTAQRPASPSAGMIRFNTSINNLEYYNGTAWMSACGQAQFVTNGLLTYLDASNPASYPGSGTTWYDLSGNGLHGTINGNISWISNGSTSYMNWNTNSDSNYINSSSARDIQDLTIIFYPDFSLSSGIAGLIGTSAPSTTYDDSLRFENVNGTGPWTLTSRNPGDINDWAYPTATTYRINGNVSTTTVSGWNIISGYRTNRTSFNSGNTFNYYLGSSAYPGRSFRGRIAIVLLYNRQLSDSEAVQNYAAFKSRFGV